MSDTSTTQPATHLEIPSGKATMGAVNATLNGTSTILLVVGLVMIKRGKRIAHQYFMLSALTTSAVFLLESLAPMPVEDR